MSQKTRTTVTTIETHEVWVIRKATTGQRGDGVTVTRLETIPPDDAAVPSSSGPDLMSEGRSETSKEPES